MNLPDLPDEDDETAGMTIGKCLTVYKGVLDRLMPYICGLVAFLANVLLIFPPSNVQMK